VQICFHHACFVFLQFFFSSISSRVPPSALCSLPHTFVTCALYHIVLFRECPRKWQKLFSTGSNGVPTGVCESLRVMASSPTTVRTTAPGLCVPSPLGVSGCLLGLSVCVFCVWWQVFCHPRTLVNFLSTIYSYLSAFGWVLEERRREGEDKGIWGHSSGARLARDMHRVGFRSVCDQKRRCPSMLPPFKTKDENTSPFSFPGFASKKQKKTF
jgi:hypothetical protein